MSGRRPRDQAHPGRLQARPASAAGAPPIGGPGPRRPVAGLVALAVVIGAALLGLVGLSGLASSSPSPSSDAAVGTTTASLGAGSLPASAPAGDPTMPTVAASPSRGPSASAELSPSAPPSSTPGASSSPGASPAATPGAVAPTSADGFDLRHTVIDIAFPFRATVGYRYSDPFLAARVGVTRKYNHARGVSASGRLLRAHDGLDLRAKRGTRVYAAFSGTVIDPATRWKPWDAARYGNEVAIVSDEPSSPGYVVIYAHLASTRVTVGDHVDRGEWIGRVGNTGNAAAEPPQLHVELRAPFRIPVHEGGRDRRIDAFDPYPSLIAADPKRRE